MSTPPSPRTVYLRALPTGAWQAVGVLVDVQLDEVPAPGGWTLRPWRQVVEVVFTGDEARRLSRLLQHQRTGRVPRRLKPRHTGRRVDDAAARRMRSAQLRQDRKANR